MKKKTKWLIGVVIVLSEKERGRFSVGEKTYKELALDYIRTIK